MGAYSFSIPKELLLAARSILGSEVFIETGTFHGNSSRIASELFPKVLTCEYSPTIKKIAEDNLKDRTNVEFVLGDSPNFLADRRADFVEKATCFWLDAHWCASDIDVGSPGQTRVLEELEAIGRLNAESIIYIDDARYYLAPPRPPNLWKDWPDITAVSDALKAISGSHKLMIFNDVICYIPVEHYGTFVERLLPVIIDPVETLKTIKVLSKKLASKYKKSPFALLRRLISKPA